MAAGTYELFLESYDDNSENKATLKEDKIIVNVYASEPIAEEAGCPITLEAAQELQ